MTPRSDGEAPAAPPPPEEDAADAAASFRPVRRRLIAIAYRMLGSMADAEDVVQDAFLRWHRTDRAAVAEPTAYLARVVTRLCLDHLKSARVKREIYVGPWLPEPLVEAPDAEAEDISLVLMLALERLSPLERAAFLLHDVFGLSFTEIAGTLGREETACRQLAARARRHVREARPRFPVEPDEGLRIADAFLEASRLGDAEGLRRLLAAEAVFYSDGGGKRPAALNPVFGRARIERLFLGLARKAGFVRPQVVHRGLVSGLPGFVTMESDGVPQATALRIEAGRVVGIYIVRNPDKLGRLTVGPSDLAGFN